MKALNVGILAAIGMLSVGATVYKLTPEGGFASKIQADAVAAASESASSSQGDTAPNKPAGNGEFTEAGALSVQGHVGNAKMLKNQAGETFLMLEVSGDSKALASAPPPVSLAIVIDKSGSMRGTRIQNAQTAAVRAVQRLHDGDDVAVVAFDTTVENVVPLTRIDASSRDNVIRRIQAIQLGGDTCISCGIEAGLSELRRSNGSVERMFVLSDGDANNGLRDVPGFRSLGERAQGQGASITTIGVDVDFNENLLSAVSVASNGRHYFVENDSQLERVFDDEAATLTQSVANDVHADIDLAQGVDLEQVFDRNFDRSGNRIRVPLGSFARGETKTILLKVKTPSATTDWQKLADVSVGFHDLASDKDVASTGVLKSELVGDASELTPLDAIVSDRIQRSETASALREANSLFSLGKADEARRRLSEQKANVEAQAHAAASSAPAKRAKDLGDDFADQQRELDRAEQGFASPPPAPAGAEPAPPSRDLKSNEKKNVAKAVELGL